MTIDRWPKWLRWLLFLPAAGLGMVAMHFVLSIVLSGSEDEASVLGIGVEGPAARWMNGVRQEVLMRFFEPWALVAAGGSLAPARIVPSVVLALGMVGLLLVVLVGQLARTGPAPSATFLRAAVGVAGAITGAVTAIRNKPVAGTASK